MYFPKWEKELFQKGEKGMKYSIFKIYEKIGAFVIGNKHHKKETLVAYEIKVGPADILSQ